MDIKVATQLEPKEVLHTLAHEYYHAILYAKGHQKHSEDACDTFADNILKEFLK